MTKVLYRVFGDKTFLVFRGLRYTKVHTKALTGQGVKVIVDKTYVTQDTHTLQLGFIGQVNII